MFKTKKQDNRRRLLFIRARDYYVTIYHFQRLLGREAARLYGKTFDLLADYRTVGFEQLARCMLKQVERSA